MTSKEIQELRQEREDALWQIAYQLAVLNEHCAGGGYPVQLVGASTTDLHGIFVALEKFARKKGY